jgi:hypothetical protein
MPDGAGFGYVGGDVGMKWAIATLGEIATIERKGKALMRLI